MLGRGLETTFIAIGFAFSIVACDRHPGDGRTDDEQALQLDLSGGEPGATANALRCNGHEPGRPVPSSKERELDRCMRDCDPPPLGEPGGCWSSCCEEVTGCSECFVR